jgi:hypothetical protein
MKGAGKTKGAKLPPVQKARKKPLPGISKRRDPADVAARKAAEDRQRLIELGVEVTVTGQSTSTTR